MEEPGDLTTSSSEHLSTSAASTSAASTATKKKSAKSRLAQPFKSLVGRSHTLKANKSAAGAEEDEMQRASDLLATDTLPRPSAKTKKDKKKAPKLGSPAATAPAASPTPADDSPKPKEHASAEESASEDGKKTRKKKTSIVRRLSNKIRTNKQEQQESAPTSEMSTAELTSEDTQSLTSSSTYGAKTPEHPLAPQPLPVNKEDDEEWGGPSAEASSLEPSSSSVEPTSLEPSSSEPISLPVATKHLEAAPPPPLAEGQSLQDELQEAMAAIQTVSEAPAPNGPLEEPPPPAPKIEDLAVAPVGDPTLTVPGDTAQNGERREHLYKILVIGELGTGKTSIIKRYVHQFFSQHYRATIGVDFALKVLTWDQNTIIRLQLWDIAGQERFGNMTRVYYKEAVGAFIVFDVTRTATFDAVLKWKADLDSKVQLPDGSPIPCVLLANKCDQQKEGIVNTPAKMDEYCKEHGFSGWYETSAKENINIDDAARFLVSKILQNDKLANHTSNKDDGFSLDKADREQNQRSCAC
ncbi:EF-hand calcium-binding domain-containing protein 4B-like [Neocloeon triangulifer]|uniref:EF-hand calcium-binding domain-containing protein 4B-like n=1 Tax=Neocloeon triangulifer TaxID=2078957 RepID=UPI00286F7BAA|nr:EF-hand calcium-binding domain-containing protein 4B-like [Neocloeon triangulifer]